MEKMVEPRTIHTANIAVLVGPSKALFADDSVYWSEFRNIWVVHILTFLNMNKYSWKELKYL